MTNYLETDVVIIGAGFSGLAASLELTLADKKIVLIEASPTPGGRARSVPWGEYTVDNGQHLLIGAYTNILDHLRKIDIDLDTFFKKDLLTLKLFDDSTKQIEVKLRNYFLPLPLNNFFGFIFSKGLSVSEKWQIIKFFFLQIINKFSIKNDIPLQEFLTAKGQSNSTIKKFWEPIALAALTTPIKISSSKIFLNIIRECFTTSKSASNFLFAKKDLSEIFAYPTINWLRNKGQTILLNTRAKEICPINNTVTTRNSITIKAKKILIATSSHSIKPLISNLPKMQDIAKKISEIDFEPIMTIYLKFAKPALLPYTMVGRIGKNIIGQWYFDRAIQGAPNIVGIVISGKGDYEKIDPNELVKIISKEAQSLLPDNNIVDAKIIKEKFAAFSATPTNQSKRPDIITPYPDIVLSGDYIKNDFPATLEGAVINGKKSAATIVNSLN